MSKPPQEPLATRLSKEERSLFRKIGTALTQILQGKVVPIPDAERPDELGVLASIASRIATEIVRARERDKQAQAEQAQRLQELQDAYRTQERLLAMIRELSSPVLNIYAGVLLMPLIAEIDRERGEQIAMTLLQQVVAHRAKVVILDITSAIAGDPQTVAVIARIVSSTRLLGARTILSGVTPQFARITVERGLDLSGTLCRANLQSALTTAITHLNTEGKSDTARRSL